MEASASRSARYMSQCRRSRYSTAADAASHILKRLASTRMVIWRNLPWTGLPFQVRTPGWGPFR